MAFSLRIEVDLSAWVESGCKIRETHNKLDFGDPKLKKSFEP